ncbi:hypothetical protein GQ55_5G196200 [Panicum hallii var. hallii]|uniref:Uncharacterized protein n=1 Tax=Panicum hallii var. hallii TaxID=1504633 RepID=A0A2T7DI38_9POAL|nr:hypothetical protein GQ55_5G196200 [Panicum hallii var. hallii]
MRLVELAHNGRLLLPGRAKAGWHGDGAATPCLSEDFEGTQCEEISSAHTPHRRQKTSLVNCSFSSFLLCVSFLCSSELLLYHKCWAAFLSAASKKKAPIRVLLYRAMHHIQIYNTSSIKWEAQL